MCGSGLQSAANFQVDWVLSLGMFFELCQWWEQGIMADGSVMEASPVDIR